MIGDLPRLGLYLLLKIDPKHLFIIKTMKAIILKIKQWGNDFGVCLPAAIAREVVDLSKADESI